MAVGKVGVDENNRPKYRMVSWKPLNLFIGSLNPIDILAMLMQVCWRLASFKQGAYVQVQGNLSCGFTVCLRPLKPS